MHQEFYNFTWRAALARAQARWPAWDRGSLCNNQDQLHIPTTLAIRCPVYIVKYRLIVFTKNLLEDVWVSNHNHQSARPRNSHIKPLRIGEEAQFVGCVHCQELVRASHLVICTNVNSELRKYSG